MFLGTSVYWSSCQIKEKTEESSNVALSIHSKYSRAIAPFFHCSLFQSGKSVKKKNVRVRIVKSMI